MKAKDMRQKSDKELITLLGETRTKLAGVHMDMRVKEMPNVKQIKAYKRDIARILTIQHEARLAANSVVETKEEVEKTNE